jgi:hypothetical protein
MPLEQAPAQHLERDAAFLPPRPTDVLEGCGYTVERWIDPLTLQVFERIETPDKRRVFWFELVNEKRDEVKR